MREPLRFVSNVSLNILSDHHFIAAFSSCDRYLDLIGAIKPAVFKALTDDERLALFLNAYNALCVNTILRWMREHDGAPPRSINDISTWRKPVWKQRAGKVAGSHVTLDYIEHSVLRTEWAEPRVHACLVCASLSCPNLRGEAYDARRLNAQMDDQTRDWLANTTKGVLVTPSTTDDSKPQITLSRIFLWFRDDFIRGESTAEDSCGAATAEMSPELAFARRYKPEVRDGAITCFPYNWSLNIAS